MPGHAFPVTITLTNPTDTEKTVKISRGTIIEPESSHLTYQSAVITKDYIFTLNPQETRSVMLDAECWNKDLSPPKTTPGKLTPLKGNIQKTTNIWGTSSTPKSPIHIKPSQQPHIFTAFVNTNSELAYNFLEHAIQQAESDGKDVTVIDKVFKTTSKSSFSSSKIQNKFWKLAQDNDITSYLTASRIREFLIKTGEETEKILVTTKQLINNIYALTTHKVASDLYQLSGDLEDLFDSRKFAVKEEEKRELTTLIRNKYTSILDALPLLDKIEWTQ